MKRFVGLVGIALLMINCEGSNELSCLDGTCSDPERPYCDGDGFYSGTQGLCIHVDCTPNMFERCVGEEAQLCTADGAGYRNTACPNGCGPTGCIGNPQCQTNAECTNPNPICDVSNKACRMCTANDECTSTVCEQGACLPESSIVYASPTGAASGNCTVSAPCNLGRAASLASSGTTGTLRLLPGIYSEILTITTPSTLTVYAKGATLTGNGRVDIRKGNVTIRDLEVRSTSSQDAIGCFGLLNMTPQPRLTLQDVSNVGNLAVSACTVTLERHTNRNGTIRVDEQGSLVADRSLFDFESPTQTLGDFIAFYPKVTVRFTNSQIINYWLQFNTTDMATTNSVTFAYSTIAATYSGSSVGPVVCGNSGQHARVGLFENDIISAPTGLNAVMGTTCTLTNNLLFPQSVPWAGNMIADPQFVNPSTKDFRPKSTSPARGAAMGGTLMTDHDYVGAVRPQGTGPDMGAFEVP